MEITDWIQTAVVVVTGFAALFAWRSSSIMNRQVELQKRQWEYSHLPKFRFAKHKLVPQEQYKIQITIENTNPIPYTIDSIKFSGDSVTIEEYKAGFPYKLDGMEERIEGLLLIVSYTEKNNEGHFIINGKTSIGTTFTFESPDIDLTSLGLRTSETVNSYFIETK